MKFALLLFGTLIAAACSQESTPSTLPGSNSKTSTATLWAMVVDQTGVCIEGATVEVVSGQDLGQVLAQRTPCGAWDYDGGVDGGVLFKDLTPGVAMTLRTSAPGYAPEEKTVMPVTGHVVLLTPSKI